MKDRHYPIEEAVFIRDIEPLIIQQYKRMGRPPKISHYQFFSAVLYLLRTGISWRDLPKMYGHWHSIYVRFSRWSENGLFWSLLYQLQQKRKVNIDCTWVDSTTAMAQGH